LDLGAPGPQRGYLRLPLAVLAWIPKVYWGLLLLVVALGVMSPRSITPQNLLELARQSSPLGVVALGQTLVIMTGGLDLSVGAVVLFSDLLVSRIVAGDPQRVLMATLLILAIGAALGLINGLLVTWARITPFVATLGVSLLVTGTALATTGGVPGGIPESMEFWGNGFVLGILPTPVVIWGLVTMLLALVLKRTSFGRWLVAVGANRQAAHVAGIRVPAVVLSAYVFSGITAAAGGWLLLSYTGVGSLTIGTDFVLGSIAATVIGGTLFTGGRGTVAGTFGGAMLMMVLYNILVVANLPVSGRLIAQGSVILAALTLYSRSRDEAR
jgi:ribose transport system permease protein